MALSGVGTGGRLRRIVLGTSGSIAGTVYGTIVVMGVVTAGSGGARGPWELIAIVVSTVLVLWIAHVYAHGLGEAIGRGRRLDRPEFVSVARRELAIPLAAVAPTAALALGGFGLVKNATAVWLAMAMGLVALAVQGARYSALEGLGRLGTVESIGLNLAFGLVIVALKAFIAH